MAFKSNFGFKSSLLSNVETLGKVRGWGIREVWGPLHWASGIEWITEKTKTKFTPVGKVDQAVRPLPLKTLSILEGSALKLISLCNRN